MTSPLHLFSEATQTWFRETFEAPTRVQVHGWKAIADGAHTLLIAPTGSGKTLAAFLWAIDLLTRPQEDFSPGVQVLYVSPLKALVYDVERNLRAPLVGIQRTAERLGATCREIRADVRTGDTPSRERQLQAKNPSPILVTTPESLYLLLGSRARENLRSVRTVIVDEIHALAPTKRGLHLLLSLERLRELTSVPPQRIALSATVRPVDEVARFLGGHQPVTVIDAGEAPRLDLEVVVPVPDMENVASVQNTSQRRGGSILAELYAREVGTPRQERGIWPAIYPELLEAITAHRSTIVFVNNRGLCERLSQRLNELAGHDLVRAHHGSVSHEQRAQIEEALKMGTIRGIVATSSLELGIDMGAVDLVIQVESPTSVSRGLQRVGRAGHHVGATSVGRLFPKFRGDLLECSVIAQRMQSGEIEAIQIPGNALDVLAQQVVAMCCDRPRTPAEILALAKSTYPYRELSPQALEAVLDMLSGRYPSAELADLRPLLSWDRAKDVLTPRRGAALVARINGGTIPDRGNYGVYLGNDGPRVGELDEEMVFETRTGDTVLLGATTWRVEEITRDRVVVSPAPGEPGRLPFWRGDGLGRPVELGRALGAFVRKLGAMSREAAIEHLLRHCPVNELAARNLVDYILEQKSHTGALPSDRAITVERFRDELGDWRICILTPFGARIHAPWAMALQRTLSNRVGFEAQLMYTDDGIVLRLADVEETPPLESLLPDPEEVETLVTEQLQQTALFAGLFRENAARSLLLSRGKPDRRAPLWAQRIRARALLATVQNYPSFPVVLETFRQCLADVFDLSGLRDVLRGIRSRKIAIHDVETRSASPFSRSLVFAYVAAYIYEQDAPLAERRAQALTLDRALLGELLGQAELRELIDPEVLAQLEQELQALLPERQARDHDELHDLLRRIGDLSDSEIHLRCTSAPTPWLNRLADERRAIAISIGGERRWIAAQDAGLYRDALGCMPTPGLPDAFLLHSERPLESLVRRYARCHGPFLSKLLAARYAMQPAQMEPVLEALEMAGELVRGEIRPGGAELDWCDQQVLRRLKRQTLARLRNEVAPVAPATLARFLADWHGVRSAQPGPEPGDSGQRGMDRLLEVIAQLEGLPLPWSALSQVLLPTRVRGFNLEMLDMLCATGAVVWVGCQALGPKDGRIAMFRRSRASRLVMTVGDDLSLGVMHKAILEHLGQRGASFLSQLEEAARGADPGATGTEFRLALWDLVWAGKITNDTFQPLRSLAAPAARSRRMAGRFSMAGGRWSLVKELMDSDVSDTESTVARAEMLLERYGIVSREAAGAEDLPGGFAPLYRVLKAMEETGRIRRGYFVEGLSGSQFAQAAALDRLRAQREAVQHDGDKLGGYVGDPVVDMTPIPSAVGNRRSAPWPMAPEHGPAHDDSMEGVLVLSAADPANPYGALLPWPALAGSDGSASPRKASRSTGAWVILVDGRMVLYVRAGGRELLTFETANGADHGALDSAFSALSRLPRHGRRKLLIVESVDGVPIRESVHLQRMKACGFLSDYRGLIAG